MLPSGQELDRHAKDSNAAGFAIHHGQKIADGGPFLNIVGQMKVRIIEFIVGLRTCRNGSEEQERNDQFTPCCSRSKSPLLVLDL